jgi:hypothetical protein
MTRRNGSAPPVGTVLSRTPGAAAVVTAVRYWFAAAWTRFGLAAVAAEYARGHERGEAAELVHGFARRMVAAGLAPGVPEARIWGHALGLADAAANAAAYAVERGAATPLALVPELAPSVLGCAPGTPAHAALVRALGPYAVLAQLSEGPGALQPPAEAHTVYLGPLGDPGQHPAPSQARLVAALLAEVMDERGRVSTAPVCALASLCLGTQQADPELAGQPQRAREYLVRDFVATVNSEAARSASPAADWPLAASPGAAALMAKLRMCFFLAWGRGDELRQAAAVRGEAEGGALLAGFARRALAAGCVPGHRAARTPDQADVLARGAAMRDADAVIWGVATLLSLCPALPDEVVGGPPGSPAAAVLARALGPFAALARPQLPGYWLDPDAQPATVTKYAAPSANPAAIGLFAPKRLPPFTPAAAAAAAPNGCHRDPGLRIMQTGLLGSLAAGAAACLAEGSGTPQTALLDTLAMDLRASAAESGGSAPASANRGGQQVTLAGDPGAAAITSGGTMRRMLPPSGLEDGSSADAAGSRLAVPSCAPGTLADGLGAGAATCAGSEHACGSAGAAPAGGAQMRRGSAERSRWQRFAPCACAQPCLATCAPPCLTSCAQLCLTLEPGRLTPLRTLHDTLTCM